jgi:hypothetical protein
MADWITSTHYPRLAQRNSQRGAALVLGMVGMGALLACAGLALDGGHLLLSKTRLQNLADSAALNAAKEFDDTGSEALARASVTEAIALNSGLAGALDSGALTVTTEFSDTLVPFTPAAGRFVRVTLSNFQLPTFLLQVVGVNTMRAGSSAVAGPSPSLSEEVCDVAPLMACGSTEEEYGHNGETNFFGYEMGEVMVLKHGSKQADPDGDGEVDDWVGPGNFHLARPGDLTGGNDIRHALAGGSVQGCTASDGSETLPLDTQPGNLVGPLRAIDSRFGEFSGPIRENDYPADCVTDSADPEVTLDNYTTYINTYTSAFLYNDYKAQYTNPAVCAANPDPEGSKKRRLMRIPVVKCDGLDNGHTDVEVLGTVCMYLVQPSSTGCGLKGGAGTNSCVFGQMVAGCSGNGKFGTDPVAGPYPTRIILYKDNDNVDA